MLAACSGGGAGDADCGAAFELDGAVYVSTGGQNESLRLETERIAEGVVPSCYDGPGHGVDDPYPVDVVRVAGVPEAVALGTDGVLYVLVGRCDARSRRALERCVATRVLHGDVSYTATRMHPVNGYEPGAPAGTATLRTPGRPDREVPVTELVGIDPADALARADRPRTIFVADTVCRRLADGLENCLRAASR